MSGRVRILLLSFATGACVMAAELVGPRLVAPHLGTSLLTWTSVIAVFLGGIAIGNALGGRLADRATRRTLPLIFVVAATSVAASLAFDGWWRDLLEAIPHAARTPLSVTLTFLPAALVLGMVSPVLGKAALGTGDLPGKALGEVAAAGALGSVFGTFLTGFVLLPVAGIRTLHVCVAAALLVCMLLAWTVAPRERASPAKPDREPSTPARFGALAALAGAALLVVEILAGRLAALHLGSSLYTWTAVIGVVLVGLGIGNIIGGRLSDRHEPRSLLARSLLWASVAVATCLWTPSLMAGVADGGGPWVLRVLLAVVVGFFLPSFALGTLSPIIVRGALSDPNADGRVVGRLYALGTVGAVAGALLTPYVLIPLMQTPLLIVVVALALAVTSSVIGGRKEIPWVAMLVMLGLLARLPMAPIAKLGHALMLRDDIEGSFVRDSPYFHIAVHPFTDHSIQLERDPDLRYASEDTRIREGVRYDAQTKRLSIRGRLLEPEFEALRPRMQTDNDVAALEELRDRSRHDVRLMSLDRLVHGFVDLQDPTHLEYDYERLTAAVVDRLWVQREQARRAYFIGGGTYTFQRRLIAQRGSGVELVTSELDPAVTEAAQRHLGLAPDPGHVIVHGDARTFLRTYDEAPFDFVFGDAFHDVAVPWHLTTVECARSVERSLSERGIYIANVVDVFDSGRFLGAFLCTLEAVFDHVALISDAPRLDERQETFLFVASNAPFELSELRDAGKVLEVTRYADGDLAKLRERANDLVLTDDYAPVEDLLAPVVRMRGTQGERFGR